MKTACRSSNLGHRYGADGCRLELLVGEKDAIHLAALLKGQREMPTRLRMDGASVRFSCQAARTYHQII